MTVKRFKTSPQLEQKLKEKGFALVTAGNEFHSKTFLVDTKNVNEIKASLVCRKNESPELFLENNPGAVFTGEKNKFGHLIAVQLIDEFTPIARVFSEKHLKSLLK